MRTIDYLELLRSRFHCKSWYELAKIAGWSDSRISNWRKRGVEFDEEACIRAAELLDMPPEKVLADIQAARTNCPAARAVWLRVARDYASKAASLGAALVLALAVMVDAGQPAAAAAPAADTAPGIKIMLNTILVKVTPSVSG